MLPNTGKRSTLVPAQRLAAQVIEIPDHESLRGPFTGDQQTVR